MQSYRLVPVGDKIVLIIQPYEQLLPDGEADHTPVRHVRASCYDFGIGRFSENEPLNEVATSVGGRSHE